MYAARIIHHSKKLRQTHSVLRERAISVCWFTKDTGSLVDKIDDIPRHGPLCIGPGDKNGIPQLPARGCFGPSHQSINGTMIPAAIMNKGNTLWTARKVNVAALGPLYNSQPQNLVKSFSTDAG
ncbi:hypothetical protein CDL12_04997 [Handroanthus impetiginosus]|uniref:Uncharacterized protein n=1 Tax=Handroanthus impetiginosus TaxID=429701 RepID=A0A2G9HXN0_9LAMI|nr:hypothetical protein CDL12_04997 [Handroanthus impetiginosus]